MVCGVVLLVAACTPSDEVVQPDLPAPTNAAAQAAIDGPATTEGDDLSTADPGTDVPGTDVPGTDVPGTGTEASSAPTPTAVPQLDRTQFDEVVELRSGESIEDAAGNQVAVHQALRWPTAVDASAAEVAGGSFEDGAARPVALDVSYCTAGVLQDNGASMSFSATETADDVYTATQPPQWAHPLVSVPLDDPDPGRCSRGWIAVAGSGDPNVARYALSVADGRGGTEDVLYQWTVEADPGADDLGRGSLSPGRPVSFASGRFQGASVRVDGWTEFVEVELATESARLVGLAVEVCPGAERWPVIGLAADGWNLYHPVQVAAGPELAFEPLVLEGEDCVEGWMPYAIPFGTVPTGAFVAGGAAPDTLASWRLDGAALPTPR